MPDIPGRPASVPADFVATPAGYFHPSCINRVADDETVQADGAISNARGERRTLAACRYPHYDGAGAVLADPERAAQSPHDPTYSGWVEDADAIVAPMKYLSATWKTPTFPYANNGQTLYYFPGLEDSTHTVSIVQPVLGWFGGHWTLASWNCCVSGNVNQSSPIAVNSGDDVYGYALGSNCVASGACANWSIYSQNSSTGASTTLNSVGYSQVMNWAFGGVLEAYDIASCQNFPASGSVKFSNIFLQTATGTSVTNTSFAPRYWGASPACGYSVGTGTQSVTVATGSTVPSGVLTPPAPTACGGMTGGHGLVAGTNLVSCDGRFHLEMQLDGNLVLYQGGVTLWSTHTNHTNMYAVDFQTDGNFVGYDLNGTVRWSSGTYPRPGATLALQNDGNLVIYYAGTAIWASGTGGH